jgi:CheY-like chemotaxis protein
VGLVYAKIDRLIRFANRRRTVLVSLQHWQWYPSTLFPCVDNGILGTMYGRKQQTDFCKASGRGNHASRGVGTQRRLRPRKTSRYALHTSESATCFPVSQKRTRRSHRYLPPITDHCGGWAFALESDHTVTTRILFVDGEIQILEGLRRSFHCMRAQWSMEFLSSGAAALESLARAPADVIVSDMDMPDMNGWQLLTEVKTLYPQTVRLVLSGSADSNSAMRAVGTAQLYLQKPCEIAAVKAATVQTQTLRQLLSSDQLAVMVGAVGTLPSAPKAFQDILMCLQDPKSSLGDAARIIDKDAAMTANIMKLVNSAFFGSRRPITTADRAVAHLGMDTLAALVLGHGVFKGPVATGVPGFGLGQLWQHSVADRSGGASYRVVRKAVGRQSR